MKLAAVFTDNMVLQQDKPIPVWGWAEPGDRVTVEFKGQRKQTTADDTGKWMLALDPLPADGMPATLRVQASIGNHQSEIHKILVGEVWICSGQSNMQWSVCLASDAEDEIREAANWPQLRLFTVPNITADAPAEEIPGTAGWRVCAPEAVRNFSAAAYAFGRHLARELKVPLGLINTSWGGSLAEAWTDRETLSSEPVLRREILEPYERDAPRAAQLMEEWNVAVAAIEERTRDTGIAPHAREWMDPEFDDSGWRVQDQPGWWRRDPELNINGVVWFRRDVEIPPSWTGRHLTLSLGACDKSETTWFNGVRVGSLRIQDTPEAWCTPRVYRVPGELVRAGRATIAVRVHSDKYAGGMTGPADQMFLRPDTQGSTGDSVPGRGLSGPWKIKLETSYGLTEIPPPPPGPGTPGRPAVLYNAMIHPLIPFAMRGAIWYQGESNADRADQYRVLFQALIRSWRTRWSPARPGAAAPGAPSGQDFPFLFVQLPNYRADAGRDWPLLRESQAAALSLPNTAMAVTIDIGESSDIHPKNKREVGRRLALSALNRVYGRDDVTCCGPEPERCTAKGERVWVRFRHTEGGLVCRGEALAGFEIAGSDGVFHPAKGRMEDESAVVWSPEVPQPAAVRYAWADDPPVSLYNGAGLPAPPFRMGVERLIPAPPAPRC